MENTPNPITTTDCDGCGEELAGTAAELAELCSEITGEPICEACNQIETEAFWAWEARQMDAARFG